MSASQMINKQQVKGADVHAVYPVDKSTAALITDPEMKAIKERPPLCETLLL